MVYFVYFSIDSIKNHRRLVLSLMSLLNTNPWVSERTAKVLVYTDCVSFFENEFRGTSNIDIVSFIHISEDKLEFMKGPDEFIHRIKICLIKEALSICKTKVIYIDADTIIVDDLSPLLVEIDNGCSVMHLNEYCIHDLALGDKRQGGGDVFLDVYKSRIGSINKKDYRLKEEDRSYNAGVIGMTYENISLLDDVMSIVDQVYPLSRHFATEQFSFSIVLARNSRIITCESYVYHYWESIKKAILDENFLEFGQRNYSKNPHLVKMKIEGHFKWQSRLLFDAFEEERFFDVASIFFKIVCMNPFRGWFFYKDVMYHVRRLVIGRF